MICIDSKSCNIYNFLRKLIDLETKSQWNVILSHSNNKKMLVKWVQVNDCWEDIELI